MNMLQAALDHAERGLPVFPCASNKHPLTERGFKDATVDAEQIKAWWGQWPKAMIGMPTGHKSGVWVLDVDQHGEDGEESLLRLRAGRDMPDTMEAMTPSGGRHIYFQLPEGADIRNSAGKLGPGLDVRGEGGYVIVPPSAANGHAYQWEGSSDPGEGVRATQAPAWLFALLSAPPKAESPPAGSEAIPEGRRNEVLFRLGRSLRAKGLTEAGVLAALRAENAARCNPPLPETEIQRVAKSAATYQAGEIPEAPEACFPFLLAHELDEAEHTAFRIEGWLEESGIGLLYAPKDTFKSFLAVDWFMSVVSGVGWHGFETKRGAGVYIAGEGNRGLRRRFRAWCVRHGYELRSLPLALSTMPMQVLDPKSIAQWAAHIARVQDDIGEAVEFITVDTLATNFGPGDENKPTDMARFLAHLRIYLQSQFNCTIVVVHHTGTETKLGARGGSAIEGNSDAVFTLMREGEHDDRRVILSCKHIKDEDRPPEMHLQAQIVEIGGTDQYGDPITSLVLEPSLSEKELLVLNNLKAGKSQRQIAELMGASSKTAVARIQRRLRRLKMVA